MNNSESHERIRAVIKKIPYGCVATYGQIAREAGFVKQPRLTGYVLARTPASTKLPWHRVINAQGRISLPPRSEAYREQKHRLQAEGVSLLRGRVDLKRYLWRPRSDAPLLD